MPRKPVAREKLLTAFEHLVLSEGERAATLDAVAARAGVSKGGLLYHFPHRQALVDAALARCEEMAREDLTRDYRADYEYYAPDGSIHLSIGVLSDT